MAVVTGVLGTVSLNEALTGLKTTTTTANLHVSGWTLNMTQDALETTTWDNASNAREYIGGLATGTGSATVLFDSAIKLHTANAVLVISEENKAAAEFVLTATSGRTYTFDGLISRFSIESSKAGLYQGTIDFQVSDDVAIA